MHFVDVTDYLPAARFARFEIPNSQCGSTTTGLTLPRPAATAAAAAGGAVGQRDGTAGAARGGPASPRPGKPPALGDAVAAAVRYSCCRRWHAFLK